MTRRHIALVGAGACGLAVLLSGCAGWGQGGKPAAPLATSIPVMNVPAVAAASAGAPTADAAPGTFQAFTFSVGDEFDLRVPDAPQFDQSLKVRPDGRFSVPLIGTLTALGRTPEQVEADIQQRLKRLAAPPSQQEYVLQANDEIELKFPYHQALNETVKLRPDGKLQLQMIGTVQAAGRTPEGLQAELKRLYARVLRKPELSVLLRTATTQNVRVAGGTARAGLWGLQPTVIVKTFQAPQVFVGGEVVKPGVLAWRPGLTVIQAIAESGWYLPTAEVGKLMVLRRTSDNRAEVLRPEFGFDLNREHKADLALQPFDVILLPKTSAANLADALNQYLFNLLPPLRNSSLGFSYVLRDRSVNN